jgi:HSP20 family molecular chaperone IbpA
MSRQNGLNSPFMLGFDEIERALDRVTKATGDGYPPYNIERIASSADGPDRLRITLAVAGFARSDIEIVVEDKQLLIRGRQNDDKERHFLHRGIASRQFQRAFLLADGLEVLGADLAHGLLSIDLVRPITERVSRKIVIDERE